MEGASGDADMMPAAATTRTITGRLRPRGSRPAEPPRPGRDAGLRRQPTMFLDGIGMLPLTVPIILMIPEAMIR